MPRKKPAPSRVTLARVAEDAGVSVATVSLILSNRGGWVEQFHPDTVQRVRASAQRLGYRRNLFACGLPSGDARFFALILRDADSKPGEWRNWALQGALLEGVSAAAEERGVYPVVASGQASMSLDTGRVSAITEGGVFGAIFQSPRPQTEELIREQLGRRQPAVVVFPHQASTWPTNAVDVDHVAVGQTAGKLLAAGGRDRWALVQYDEMSEPLRLRCEGFIQAARQSEASLVTIALPSQQDEDGASDLVARQLSRCQADAIFAVDSPASIASVRGSLQAGLSPGGDCHILGCDASQWKVPGMPRITSVDVSWKQVGATAVERLLHARVNKGRFRTVLLPPRVVYADTCPAPTGTRPAPRTAGKRIAC